MWWIVAIIIVVIVVAVWGVVGGTFPSTGTNGGPPRGQGCDACKGLTFWWQGLSHWQKQLQASWYWHKRLHCWLKGCPTS